MDGLASSDPRVTYDEATVEAGEDEDEDEVSTLYFLSYYDYMITGVTPTSR